MTKAPGAPALPSGRGKLHPTEQQMVWSPWGDDHDPAAVPAGNRPPDTARQSDPLIYLEYSRKGHASGTLTGLNQLWLKLFVQPAEQLGYKAGKFPFDPAPEEGALVPVNCWIWNKGSGR